MSNIERHFRFFQGILAALHIGSALTLAIYAESEDKDWTTDVLTEYNAWVGPKNSSCASGDGCYIYSVEENFSSSPLSLIWATASFSLISGVHHLVACIFFDWYLEKCVHSGVNVARWIDYAGSSAIMFAVISILFMAPPTITGLVSAYVLQFLVIVAGAGSDVAWKLSNGSIRGYSYSKGLFYTTLLAYVFPWAFLIAQYQIAVDADPQADSCGIPFPENAEKKDPPAFVTAAIIGLFATFSLFALVQGIKIHTASLKNSTMLKVEYFFSLLSFVSKISLLGNVAAGIIGRSDNNISLAPPAQNGTLAFSSSSDGDDTELFDTFLWSSVGASAFLGLVMIGSAYYIGFESYDNIVLIFPQAPRRFDALKNIAPAAKLVF
tara:strand:+ start:6400 stop:7539 length:1140 start_codon:yes stop_codon:yes gene_type:complete